MSRQRTGVGARLGAGLALWLQLTSPGWSQETAINREYQVKAVFLFNFTRFVDWPQSAFPGTQSPLSICVLGEDPFGQDLIDVIAGETAQGRPLVVTHVQSAEAAGSCHILYVSRSEAPRLDAIQAALDGKPILTVSDAEEFIRSGGMVRLDTVSGKIRLTINLEEARSAGLTMSSKLLRFADIVPPG